MDYEIKSSLKQINEQLERIANALEKLVEEPEDDDDNHIPGFGRI